MTVERKLYLLVLTIAMIILVSYVQNNTKLEESIKRGETIYQNNCITCHMLNGEGIPGAFPPLAKSDYLMDNPQGAIKAVIFGLSGEITVNEKIYFGEMAPLPLSDQEIADVMNYARNSWGNDGKEILKDSVENIRNNTQSREP